MDMISRRRRSQVVSCCCSPFSAAPWTKPTMGQRGTELDKSGNRDENNQKWLSNVVVIDEAAWNLTWEFDPLNRLGI